MPSELQQQHVLKPEYEALVGGRARGKCRCNQQVTFFAAVGGTRILSLSARQM